MRAAVVLWVVVVGCGAAPQEGPSAGQPCARLDPAEQCAGVCGQVSTGCPGEVYDCACPAGQRCLDGRCGSAGDVVPVADPGTETATGGAQPDVTQQDAPQPDATQPDATQPDVTQPDVTQPDVTQPDVTQPDVTQQGANDESADVRADDPSDGNCSCCGLVGGANRGREGNAARREAYRACVARGGGCGGGCPRPPSARRAP